MYDIPRRGKKILKTNPAVNKINTIRAYTRTGKIDNDIDYSPNIEAVSGKISTANFVDIPTGAAVTWRWWCVLIITILIIEAVSPLVGSINGKK